MNDLVRAKGLSSRIVYPQDMKDGDVAYTIGNVNSYLLYGRGDRIKSMFLYPHFELSTKRKFGSARLEKVEGGFVIKFPRRFTPEPWGTILQENFIYPLYVEKR